MCRYSLPSIFKNGAMVAVKIYHTTLIFILTFLVFTLTANSQYKSWTTFTTSDGLADILVNDIYEDSSFNMWFGTPNGVSKYDGVVWENYTINDGLSGTCVFSICEDNQGAIWFGTDQGACRYSHGLWESFLNDSIHYDYVYKIFKDSTGAMWFGTEDNGVYCYYQGKWKKYTTTGGLPSNYVKYICEDNHGRIWLGTDCGACCYIDGKWKILDGLLDDDITDMYIDNQGVLYFGTWGGGVSRYSEGILNTYTTANGLSSNYIFALSKDDYDILWISTIYGLDCFKGTNWEAIDNATDIPIDPIDGILTIYKDSFGYMWFGSHDKGVCKYNGNIWGNYTTNDGLCSNNVNSIYRDKINNLWFATEGGLNCLINDKFLIINEYKEQIEDNIIEIYEDNNNYIWFGLSWRGLIRYKLGEWKYFTHDDGLISDHINTICEDNNGNLWFGSKGSGISIYNGLEWTTYDISNGLPTNDINKIYKDSNNYIWMASDQGAYCYKNNKWYKYNLLSTDYIGVIKTKVNSILEDNKGQLWFSTWGCGIYCYDGIEWKHFIQNSYTDATCKDKLGGIWFTTWNDGLYRYYNNNWSNYTGEDGLTYNYPKTINTDNLGNIWIGLKDNNGVDRFRVDEIPPNTKILLGPSGIKGTSQLIFTYKGGDNLTSESDLKYSYAITSNNDLPKVDDWSENYIQTFIETPPLVNGTYTFNIRAIDKLGNIDLTPDKRTFTIDITPPTVAIISPPNDDIVHGEVNIVGLAFDNSDIPDFKSYTLEYGKGSDENKVSVWHSIMEDKNQPVVNGLLGTWDTKDLFGTYTLRLRAVDGFDHRSKYILTVRVVAAVNEVDRRDGGHVIDVAKKVDLYIPPNGIPENKQITITPVAGDEITISTDQQLELAGSVYDIDPLNLKLLKTTTLSFLNVNSKEFTGKRMSICSWSETNGRWVKIGGTVDDDTGKITAPINMLGRYALMYDLSDDVGNLSISGLDCQPRAFSPKGGGFDTRTTITFTLGKSTNVTVKVYDSSGRLRIKVTDGEMMNQGSNAIMWDGRDNDGKVVVSGLYIVTVEAGSKMAKMTVGVINK